MVSLPPSHAWHVNTPTRQSRQGRSWRAITQGGEPEESECGARAEEGKRRAATEPARRLVVGRTPRHRVQPEEEVVGAALAGDGVYT